MLGGLNALFEDVMSGREYDEQQVKNATNLTNTMIKVLRFEFDVYKHFAQAGVVPKRNSPTCEVAVVTPNPVEEESPPGRFKPRNDFTGIPRKGMPY